MTAVPIGVSISYPDVIGTVPLVETELSYALRRVVLVQENSFSFSLFFLFFRFVAPKQDPYFYSFPPFFPVFPFFLAEAAIL